MIQIAACYDTSIIIKWPAWVPSFYLLSEKAIFSVFRRVAVYYLVYTLFTFEYKKKLDSELNGCFSDRGA